MKRILGVLSVMALSMSIATAAESQLQNYVNKKLEPVTKKEREMNAKAEANRKANEAKKAEYQKRQAQRQTEYKKQQAAREAELAKQRKEAETRRQNTKNAIQAEKDYWKSLKK